MREGRSMPDAREYNAPARKMEKSGHVCRYLRRCTVAEKRG
jgi:hypothetical protein